MCTGLKWKIGDIEMARMPKILIADDEPQIVELLTSCLEGKGYELVAAHDGNEALARARRGDIDLILLDIMMPGKDGHEVCRELQAEESTRNIAIIFVTAKGEVEDITSGFELGAVDYVSKPFDIPVIIARVNAAVRNKVLHDQLRQRNFLLRDLTYTDELTGLRNRRFFDERIDEEIERAQRYGHPLTCLAIKADNCDEIEHRMGAESGRDVIAEVAMVIRSNTRSFDIVVSYDTHLFAIALPHTSIKEGLAYGKKIQDEIGSRVFLGGPVAPVQVTVSVGVAEYSPETVHSGDDLLDAARRALNSAKRQSAPHICAYAAP